ncbi:MAG: hypothetical protein QG577_802 [Thermodesulfobacteriota bacterium]|nr:hypothetical protein [Thermodesulfobacteriota bacterium]
MIRYPESIIGWRCLLLACVFIGFFIGRDTTFAQSRCAAEMEEWTGILQGLRAAMAQPEILENQSVTDAVREKVEAPGRTVTIAQTVRGVIRQKNSLLEEARATCLRLSEKEKLAYKNLSKCASSGAAKKDTSLTEDFKSLSKERDLVLADLKRVLADPAFAQYQNQQPPSPNDYQENQYSHYQSPNRGQWGGYPPQSSYFYGRGGP